MLSLNINILAFVTILSCLASLNNKSTSLSSWGGVYELEARMTHCTTPVALSASHSSVKHRGAASRLQANKQRGSDVDVKTPVPVYLNLM